MQFDSGKVVKRIQEEVRILVVAEHQQVDDDDNNHQEFLFPVFFGFFDPFANKEVRDDTEN